MYLHMKEVAEGLDTWSHVTLRGCSQQTCNGGRRLFNKPHPRSFSLLFQMRLKVLCQEL